MLTSAKNKQNLRTFFFFLKVLIKGYFHAKFQLPTVSLFPIHTVSPFPNPIHRTSIQKSIQKSPFILELRKLRSSEKVEILQIVLTWRVAQRENIIFYCGWKKQHFFLIFSAELFVCEVNFKFYLNIFIFLDINTNQTSEEQYLN